MIKPHGAETLQPLYVSDDAQRAELTKRGGKTAVCFDFFGCRCISRYACIRLLYTAHGIHEYR